MKALLKSCFVLIFLTVSIILTQPSCTKDDPSSTPVTYPVAGLWIGTYTTDQVAHSPLFCSFAFYPDGTLLIKSKGNPPAQDVAYADGTWTQTGDSIFYTSTTINYSSELHQRGAMKFDDSGKMSGAYWIDVTPDGGQYYTGKFPTMDRVNK